MEQTDEELLELVKRGNVSDSVLRAVGSYVEREVNRLVTTWVNSDITVIKSDLGVLGFHEGFRQKIKTLMLLKTHFMYDKYQGMEAAKETETRRRSRR